MAIRVGRIEINNDIKSEEYLQVNCCGIYEKVTELPKVIRPNGRKDYQLMLFSKGSAIYKYRNRKIVLSGGEMIIIPPDEPNDYIYEGTVDALWIHFSGTAIEHILDAYHIEPYTKYIISNAGHFFVYAEKIVKELQLKRAGYMNNCNGYLLQLLTLAKRRIDAQTADPKNRMKDLISVVEDMKTNYAEEKDLTEYAKLCNISVSRFTHLFTDMVGESPHKYLLGIRMTQAKYLLAETNIQIADIAKNVGYDDPYYFSRIFKKYTGQSPSAYRNDASKLK